MKVYCLCSYHEKDDDEGISEGAVPLGAVCALSVDPTGTRIATACPPSYSFTNHANESVSIVINGADADDEDEEVFPSS